MRISDWSSDVCSSDLVGLVPTLHYHATLNPLREFSNDGRTVRTVLRRLRRRQRIQIHHAFSRSPASRLIGFIRHRSDLFATDRYIMRQIATYKRSEERTVWKGWVSTLRSRG